MIGRLTGLVCCSGLLALGLGGGAGSEVTQPATATPDSRTEVFEWNLPAGFPVPLVPDDNPMSRAKVDLGRYLFFDSRLSSDGTFSCASCHRPELAFTDGREQAVGVTGEIHPRSSMSLANVVYSRTLTWADPGLDSLEEQMLTPMFSADPVELGLQGMKEVVLARLREEPMYERLFAAAYPEGNDPIGFENVVRAIASFERTIVSGNSPYDRYVYWGETDHFPETARRGMRLFFSDELRCSECHAGFTFSGPIQYMGGPDTHPEFHNTGLYNIGGTGAYPPGNQGLIEHTAQPEDMGHFRAPTLRNIEITAPYTHDGSVPTLGELIAHYSTGGRSLHIGAETEIGRDNPFKSEEVGGFDLTDLQVDQLLAFLEALTDESFLVDSRFQDPWTGR